MMIDLNLTKVNSSKIGSHAEVISITPLPPGFGMTLGNAFRRVLLSSLPGAAVTGVKIDGVTHEFSTIPGVKESVIDIVLNLKLLRLRKYSPEPLTMKLSVNKSGEVTAADIETPSDIEIVTPDLVLFTLGKKTKVEMTLYVDSGVGYVPVSARERTQIEPGVIEIDAMFSPVRKVRYEVSNTRVGQMTDLDKLDIEVETDGTVSPQDIMSYASQILGDYTRLLNFSSPIQKAGDTSSAGSSVGDDSSSTGDGEERQYTPVETLRISPRTLNALINNGIGSIQQLEEYSPKQLANIKGFGKKAMVEVEKALNHVGKSLKSE